MWSWSCLGNHGLGLGLGLGPCGLGLGLGLGYFGLGLGLGLGLAKMVLFTSLALTNNKKHDSFHYTSPTACAVHATL